MLKGAVMHTHKIVDGERVDLTVQEIAEIEAQTASFEPIAAPAAPTKEQLLAQINALAAQIQALE